MFNPSRAMIIAFCRFHVKPSGIIEQRMIFKEDGISSKPMI